MATVELTIDGVSEVFVEASGVGEAWSEAMHYAARYMAEPWENTFEIRIKKEGND